MDIIFLRTRRQTCISMYHRIMKLCIKVGITTTNRITGGHFTFVCSSSKQLHWYGIISLKLKQYYYSFDTGFFLFEAFKFS